MSKTVKKWLLVATLLVVFGALILVATACSAGWDFGKFNTDKYEANTYEVHDEFSNISIKTSTADIVFAPSEDGNCKVVCDEQSNLKHLVSATDGTLKVELVDTRKWYQHIGVNFGTQKITVYLPNAEYSALVIEESTGDIQIPKDFKFNSADISLSTGDVRYFASATEDIKIKRSTGDVYVQNISARSLNISGSTGNVTVTDVVCEGDVTIGVSTGKTHLTNVTCKNLISSGDTGDISLKNVIAVEKFSIERSTGDVKLEGVDAAEIFVKTSTGDVEGSLLSGKNFIIDTNTGTEEFPHGSSGGKCEITTSTGDIKITVK